jgi:hypothetical protein
MRGHLIVCIFESRVEVIGPVRATGLLTVKSRSTDGQVAVRSQSSHGPITVRSQFANVALSFGEDILCLY